MSCWGRRVGAQFAAVAIFAAGLAGCSTYPLPQDVSRKNTYDIVEKLRCEAQEGLRAGLVEVLGTHQTNHRFLTDTVIGYDFVFDIVEDNNASSGKLEFDRRAFRSGSSFGLDFSSLATLQRKNRRDFRIIESLSQLNKAKCSTDEARKNWVYPITGAVGLDEVVRTYIRLEKLTSFKVKGQNDPIIFSDKLDFTTDLQAGVQPDLTLATPAGSLRLSKLSILGQAKRKDIHTVTVAISRGANAPADEQFERSLRRTGADRTLSLRATRGLDAVAQRDASGATRVVLELERRRALSEEEAISTRLIEILKSP
jgi:hypothetical protein